MKRHLWILPATASLAFFAFSARVMVTEGPLGFVALHLDRGWGAQIGIDLVNCLIVSLVLAVPVARRSGVQPLPWVLLSALTGSVGLLAFVARILYVRENGSQTGG